MSHKLNMLTALVIIPAVFSFGSAMADDAQWVPPKVVGQPGYKEPPKKEGPAQLAIPVKDRPAKGGAYQVDQQEDSNK